MAELKTQPRHASVEAFLRGLDEPRRKDCLTVLRMMKQATRAEPTMWGSALVGFGQYHYKYASGHEGDSFLAGFAPRKQNLTLYISSGLHRYPELLGKLGPHKRGKSCLHIKQLADVDLDVLKELIQQSVRDVKKDHAGK